MKWLASYFKLLCYQWTSKEVAKKNTIAYSLPLFFPTQPTGSGPHGRAPGSRLHWRRGQSARDRRRGGRAALGLGQWKRWVWGVEEEEKMRRWGFWRAKMCLFFFKYLFILISWLMSDMSRNEQRVVLLFLYVFWWCCGIKWFRKLMWISFLGRWWLLTVSQRCFKSCLFGCRSSNNLIMSLAVCRSMMVF